MGSVEKKPIRAIVTEESTEGSSITDSVLYLDENAINPAFEKALVRKCDLHVIPMIAILYMLAFIDRINIGNARIQGLEKDLHMKGHDYNIALFIFFIPYIIFEVPSNILIKKIAPSTWLSSIMVCWGRCISPRHLGTRIDASTGIVTVCMGVTKSFAGLIICRFLLGLFEAGFFPGKLD